MTQTLKTMKSVLTKTETEDRYLEPVNRKAGLGGLFGIIAAILGLGAFLATDLLPLGSVVFMPFQAAEMIQNSISLWLSAAFFGLIALGLIFQTRGIKSLNDLLESGSGNLIYIALIGAIVAVYSILNATTVNPLSSTQINNYILGFAPLFPIFIITWQILSHLYIDTSNSYLGLLAGLFNALFFPVFALSFVNPAFYGIGVVLAYVFLLAGQIMTMMFWWAPKGHIREYARSSDTAKLGFGILGVLSFAIGAIPLLFGPLDIEMGIEVWKPWSTAQIVGNTLIPNTPPWAVMAFLSMLLVWVLLAPRLGSRELKEAVIRRDVVAGGGKYLMILMAVVGIFAAVQVSALFASQGAYLLFLAICPAAIMIMMGASYAGSNDLLIGLPLIVAGFFSIITPESLAFIIITSWLLVLATQAVLMIECKIRGHTAFSQPAMTVIITILSSVAFISFLLGLFGTAPPAIWPANQWFNLGLFPGVPIAVEAPTIFGIVILSIVLRNFAVLGYAYGATETQSSSSVLRGMTVLFSLLVVMIAGNFDLTNQALTAAAIMFALYSISFVLVLTLNLELGSRILREGHELEGNFIRVATAVGLAFGAIVGIIAVGVFSGFPEPITVAVVISLLITLIAGLEIICILTWLSAGIRLGLLRGGFKYSKPAELIELTE